MCVCAKTSSKVLTPNNDLHKSFNSGSRKGHSEEEGCLFCMRELHLDLISCWKVNRTLEGNWFLRQIHSLLLIFLHIHSIHGYTLLVI